MKRAPEEIAREIVQQVEDFAKLPENPEGPDVNTFLMDLITKAITDERSES